MFKARYDVPVAGYPLEENSLAEKLEETYRRHAKNMGIDLEEGDVEVRVYYTDTVRDDDVARVVFESNTDEELSQEVMDGVIDSEVPRKCEESICEYLQDDSPDNPEEQKYVDEDGWEDIPGEDY